MLDLPKIFGAAATQTASTLTIDLVDLAGADATAESILVALLLKAETATNRNILARFGNGKTAPITDGDEPLYYSQPSDAISIDFGNWQIYYQRGRLELMTKLTFKEYTAYA